MKAAAPIIFNFAPGCQNRHRREAKFWLKVAVAPGIDECWPWTGKRWKNGYGQITISGHTIGTHRFAYFLIYGQIPGGKFVLHDCDNPPCCNPFHLYSGTPKNNTDDCVRRGRARGGRFLGEAHGYAKLSNEDVLAIRTSPDSYSTLAANYGVGKSQIGRIKNNQHWRHL